MILKRKFTTAFDGNPTGEKYFMDGNKGVYRKQLSNQTTP